MFFKEKNPKITNFQIDKEFDLVKRPYSVDQGMKKHLKHQENAFPAINHSSGHFRPINRPNRESSKIAKNRDFR